jgi:hypothetical protein
MNWDFLVGVLVILAFVLVIWAKVSKQTVGEVLSDIKNMFSDAGDDIEEKAEEVISYE